MAKTIEAPKNSIVSQTATVTEWNGNLTLNVVYQFADGRPDRWATQVGTRKVRDVLRHLGVALQLLEASKYPEDQELVKKFKPLVSTNGKKSKK